MKKSKPLTNDEIVEIMKAVDLLKFYSLITESKRIIIGKKIGLLK